MSIILRAPLILVDLRGANNIGRVLGILLNVPPYLKFFCGKIDKVFDGKDFHVLLSFLYRKAFSISHRCKCAIHNEFRATRSLRLQYIYDNISIKFDFHYSLFI